MRGFPGRQVQTCRCALWLAVVESFDLRYNLRFKIIRVGVGGVKSIGTSDLLESESKLCKTYLVSINKFLISNSIYSLNHQHFPITLLFKNTFQVFSRALKLSSFALYQTYNTVLVMKLLKLLFL